MRVYDKVAVVTGGGSGIGAASARLLAHEGARLAILDCNLEAGQAVAASIRHEGAEALAIACDVSRDAQVRESMQQVAAVFGCIDILFNNAGLAVRQPVGEQEEEGWDRVVETNLKGAYLCSRHALPHFPDRGGSIIHAASVTGITGVRSRAAYSAAKGAIVALTRNMALDYAPRHIRVNCVCPGFVKTPFIAALLHDPQRSQRLTAMHPLGRLGEPEDIAYAVLFLASEESSWMTGQSLVVDGGFSAGHAEEI